jgi:proliferating cell nuclear antigen
MAGMGDEMVFKFQPSGLNVRQFDPSHTVCIDLTLPKEVWDSYTPVDNPMLLKVRDISNYLKKLRSEDVVVLKGELEKESKLLMGVRGAYGFRRFGLLVMEPGEDNVDPPAIKMFTSDVKAKVAVPALQEAITDAGSAVSSTKTKGAVTGFFSIEARSKPERLVVWATEEGSFRSSWYEFQQNLGLLEMECAGEKIRSTYGLAQVKCVLSLPSLSNIIKVEYAEDFPIKFSYQLAFPGKLEFYLAPRVEMK